MKINSKFLAHLSVFIILLAISSCSKSEDLPGTDDGTGNGGGNGGGSGSNFTTKNVTALGGNIQAREVFQMDITAVTNSVNTSNLTLNRNVPFEAFYNVLNNDLITWFERTGFNYNAWQRRLSDQSFEFFPEPCDLGMDEAPDFFANNETDLFTFTVDIIGTDFITKMYVYEGNSSCSSLQLPTNLEVREVSTSGNLVLIYASPINGGQSSVLKVDLNTLSVVDTLNLDQNTAPSMVINGNDFHIFYSNNTYRRYALDSFELLETKQINLGVGGDDFGFFDADFKGNNMYFTLRYPQPSTVGEAAAVIDLETGQIVKGDNLFALDLQSSLGTSGLPGYFLSDYDVDTSDDIIVYGLTNPSDLSGGILYTNFEGEILATVLLPQSVYEVIIKD